MWVFLELAEVEEHALALVVRSVDVLEVVHAHPVLDDGHKAPLGVLIDALGPAGRSTQNSRVVCRRMCGRSWQSRITS